jgi:hypothetical protein
MIQSPSATAGLHQLRWRVLPPRDGFLPEFPIQAAWCWEQERRVGKGVRRDAMRGGRDMVRGGGVSEDEGVERVEGWSEVE